MRLNLLVGFVFSLVVGTIYMDVLHEPGAIYYPFAVLVFLGGPILAGVLAVRRGQRRTPKSFAVAAGTVFLAVVALFVTTYAVWPQFENQSVRLPASCSDRALVRVPPALQYRLPDGRAGILITAAEGSAIVAIAAGTPPYQSSVYLVNTAHRRVLSTLVFPNDVIMASIAGGIAYIYNDKLGYLLSAPTGKPAPTFLIIDNYAGLSRTAHPVLMNQPGDAWYVQINGVVSAWGTDGSVHSRARMRFNAIAMGCFVDGTTGRVTPL